MKNYENAVFVSYAWGGESERTVDTLEQAFAERGIRIVRDKKDLGYKGSIKEFEQRIGRGQCVVLVISDAYLRSEHCMYELVEVDQKQNLRARIFPIVLADAQIYKPIGRVNYIKYWEEQIQQLNQALRDVDQMTNLPHIMADLDKYAHIRASFDHLSDLLSDMNALTPEMHVGDDCSTLIDAVEGAMPKRKTGLVQPGGTILPQIQAKAKQVEFVLEGEPGEFNSSRQQEMVGVLATLLRIKPDSIRVLRVSRGSIVVTMEMPEGAANRLYERTITHDFRMMSLRIKSVKVEDREIVELRTSSVEFVNRADELRQLDLELLRASELSPSTQIHAPVGYGKSYLLQKLIKAAHDNVELKSKWSICYIDFSEDVNNQRQLIQDRITGTLQQNFSVEQLCDHVINNLAGPYSKGRRAVLLVLDSIEKLDLESETYLIEFFVELFNRIHPNPNREIITTRVILSGRKVDEFWGKYEKRTNGLLAPNKVALTPFKDNAIEQLVGRQASNLNISLSATDIKGIAYEVQYLSGGHPKIIRDLVDVLARRSFAIGSPRDYFSNNRVTLVENQVSPVANALLENIVDELKETICVLSTFRRLTANTISALISERLLSKEIQGIDLLEQMSKAHLLDSPKFDDPFYRDHLMQRVLALKMAHSIQCQDSYMQCNKVALEMYEKLILQPPSSATSANTYNFLQRMQPPYFFVEWLYHALQDPQITDGELRKRFDELALCLLGAPRSQGDINLLKERIEQDFEIVYLARNRFKEGGISIISKWLNQP